MGYDFSKEAKKTNEDLGVSGTSALGTCNLNKKRIGALKDVTDVQTSDGNWNHDAYMHGMANGLILAMAIMGDVKPEYLEAPEKGR